MNRADPASILAPPLGDIPPDVLRPLLHQVADWAADYRAGIESRRISPRVQPGEIAAGLPHAIPENPEPLQAILADLDERVMPGVVHWGHPSFLGYFGSTSNGPALLAEVAAAALNVSAMTWKVSPAATELETVVLGWLRGMLGLAPEWEGIVYDTGSVAAMHALAAAREALGLDVRRRGLAGRSDVPTLRVYASDQAHSSAEKAAIALGIGEENVRRIASDGEFRMDVEQLRGALDEDERAGCRPLAVIATVGTTSTASVDPVDEIADVCAERGVWLHVDAAYGGAMAVLPEGRWALHGCERADSMVVNPHKWLFVPLDFSALFTRRPDWLRRTFSLVPEYLRGDAAGDDTGERDYMDYGIQLGRRFRALKAWMVFRAFGRSGIEARIREHCRLARLWSSWVEAEEGWEMMAPTTMSVVCFRHSPAGMPSAAADAHNEAIAARINAEGELYLTHTKLRGRAALRIGLGNL
ncbi:MAG TPA: pyridoxal-dependent decarboxylase, partial [Longimicrobium sp.]|nr:pyridoxal-dependent decarboxylase [Longimicrobium sp.]